MRYGAGQKQSVYDSSEVMSDRYPYEISMTVHILPVNWNWHAFKFWHFM